MIERLRAELRRAAEGDGPSARHAEVALAAGPLRRRLECAILALAELRGPHRSICPSDAARAVGGADWRDLMAEARGLARELAKSGRVQITQGDSVVDPDSAWRGPIRIRIAGC